MKWLLWLSVLFVSAPASAMGVRSNTFILAWSDDGRSALLSTVAHGPEGGGRQLLHLVSLEKAHNQTVEVSNDLSAGGPKHPEKISASECQKRVQVLADSLKTLVFTGVEAKAAACKRPVRDAIVRTLKKHAEQAQDSFMKPSDSPPIEGKAPAAALRYAKGASGALLLAFRSEHEGAALDSAYAKNAAGKYIPTSVP
jgi:hypothetical protein